MYTLTREELKTLLDKQTGICISLFMPTYRTSAEMQQNQIRFKNMLRKTEEKLLEAEVRPQEIKTLLEPAQTLTGNVPFWRRRGDGLAIFIAAGLFRSYILPLACEETIFVADRFHIKPLLPLLQGSKRFHILALSQNSVRFLTGNRHHIEEMEVESLPRSLAEALSYDEPEKQVRFRSGIKGGGDRGAMISGHGPDMEDTKENLLKYFRLIDRALKGSLRDEDTPLVLAGVDYLFPIYREINTYPRLMEAGISGNPESISVETLHAQAWEIVEPHFRKAEKEALEQYFQSIGTGLTSKDIKEIVPASLNGRVGLLFVALGKHQWGTYNPADNAVLLQEEELPGGEDLADLSALQTFLSGGTVFALPIDNMPEKEPLAALFRY